ncbi:MAG: DUF3383 family protein [Alphaproteobacteria bacterium]|nr:DUF3383 family protein [Alphaproteobacteria bacterium]MBQ3946363.1 DUF3383 family protein [Alphaproteobacteria bacterium]
MAQIALSNVINISLSALPQGLTKYRTNNIALFSNETTSSVEPYIAAVSAAEIEQAYGTNSLTAKMARAVFTPAFNLRTGEGTLFVFHYDGVNAVAESQTTVAITPTILTAFKLVSNGDLTIDIDGVDYALSGLDFTNISTVGDIVKILKNTNIDCDIEVVETNKIKFTSRKHGADSEIVLKATTGGSGTDIYGSSYLNGASAVSVQGANASGTTLANAVAAAEEQAFFGGILTTQYCENSLILANATAIQGKDHIYYEAVGSLKNIETLGNSIKSAGDGKTRLLAYSYGGAEGAKQAIATYATMASSTNYNGADTCLTMNLKTLTGILPDLNLNQTYVGKAKDNGVDIYGSLEGLGVVFSNNNNGYTDDITGQLWLKKDLEVQGFNYLRKTNTKIPQTESGMAGLKNAYEMSLIQGVANGFIGAGVGWGDDVAIPFGNPEDFRRNILERGYYIYSLPISAQSSADREERKAPVIQIAIKSAGAIHSSNVIVNISA